MNLNITKQDRKALKKVFENFGRLKSDEEIFYDLVFCLLAPQTTFKSNIKVTNELRKLDFYHASIPTGGRSMGKTWYTKKLPKILKPVRFYRNKSNYLIEAKKKFPVISYIIKGRICNLGYVCDGCPVDLKDCINESYQKREWLVKNVKGLGMKTASHFLRNLGDTELAILDVHIIKFLNKNIGREGFCGVVHQGDWDRIIKTRKGYLLAEKVFQKIAKDNNLNSAYLDAYLWKTYSGTKWEDFKF